jgi:hypothetical protein
MSDWLTNRNITQAAMDAHMATKEVCLSAHGTLVAKAKEQIINAGVQVAGTGVEAAVATVLVRVPQKNRLRCCLPRGVA